MHKRFIYNKRLQGVVVLILLFLACTVFSVAQDYLVHQYTESNGLPSSVVYDIFQDKAGVMWFATQNGIARFDGVHWNHFPLAEKLPYLSFINIKQDRKGRIWILIGPQSSKAPIAYYDGKNWHKIPAPLGDNQQEIQPTSFELLEPRQETEVPMILAVGTNQGLFTWNGKEWKQISGKDGLNSNTVNDITAVEGKLYVAADNGLYVVHLSPHPQVDKRMNAALSALLPDQSGRQIRALNAEFAPQNPHAPMQNPRIWFCGNQWIGFLEEEKIKKIYPLPGLNLKETGRKVGIFPDYQNGIYIAHRFKIQYFNYRTGTLESIGIKNGLIDEGANSICIDYEKNAWIACDRGVSKIASRRFGSFQKKHGLLEDEVTAVAEYEPGKFVFGHNIGLTFFDMSDRNNTPILHRHMLLLENGDDNLRWRAVDMKIDSKKNIWVALAGNPLLRVDKYGEKKYFGPGAGLPLPAYSLWIDPDDTLWVGTANGLYIMKDHGFEPWKLNIPGAEQPNIRKIFKPSANNGRVYLATPGAGLYEYNNQVWRQFRYHDNSSANDIYALWEDSKGRLLLGTFSGLFTLADNEIKPFISGQFKIERPIFFIIEDNYHHLWFGTDLGVIRWDGDDKKALNYSTSEGLIGLETNRAAGYLDSQGRVWIGTNRGVSVYNPSFDNLNSSIPPPKIGLLELEVANKKIPLPHRSTATAAAPGDKIQLTYEENSLTFSFRGISFLDETRLRFKAKLEGFDRQWSEELYPYSHVVRYRSLPPGRYRFLLKAKNALGIWSEAISSPVIHIQRPFYQRWWFYLLVLLAVGFFLTAVYRFIYQKRYAALLTKEIHIRTRQLKVTEEKYASLFQEIKDVVYISSPDGKLVDMNPAGVELFGFKSKEEILNVDITIDMYDNPRDRRYFKKAIAEQGFVKDYEMTLKRKNGEKFVVLLTATAVRDETGEILSYRGIMRDITEKKKLEQQLERAQKMKAIGMLAGGVAHDLNNILTGLTSYPELLLMQIPNDSPLRKPLLTIKQTGEKAAAMVQDLLTLSRRGVEGREIIQLNDVVRDYLESPEFTKLKTYHPDARFDIRLAPELLNLTGSPIHLFKTVMNLMSNAVEAMPHGGTVRVNTENRYLDTTYSGFDTIAEGEYVVLCISDTGVGISPDEVSRIFEPFFTRKEMGRSGTGLGMSVVWATVKDHHGYIDILTQKGQGTTFELYFPATRQEKLKKPSPVPIEKYMGNEKILIIDDVLEQREVATGILTQLGYRVTAVASGEEAAELMKSQSFDLLIIDMIIEKGIDGLETYRRIIHEHPRQKAVIVSGFSKTEKVKEMQRLGAGIYVKKPYTIEQIGRAIRDELDSHEKAAARRL